MNKTLLVLNLDFSESYHECSTHRFVGSYELTKYSSHIFICLPRIMKNFDLHCNNSSATQKNIHRNSIDSFSCSEGVRNIE